LKPSQILFLDDTKMHVLAAQTLGILAQQVEKPQAGEQILSEFLEI